MEFNVYCFVFILSLSHAVPYHDKDDYDYHSEDFDQEKPETVIEQTERPVKRYEVTENVDDIPSPSPPINSILANYTTKRPLNIVKEVSVNKSDSSQDTNIVNNVTNNVKTELINDPYYFDFNKENPGASEVDVDNDHDYSNEEFHEIPEFLPSLRAYLHGLGKGIINGLNTLVGRRSYEDVNSDVNEYENTNPLSFLEKLGKKSHLAKNSKYFGHDFDDC